jgi:hypothetical protein
MLPTIGCISSKASNVAIEALLAVLSEKGVARARVPSLVDRVESC